VFERWHAAIEAHLERCGVPSVLVRPGAFMTNLLGFAGAIAHTGRLYAPAADARIAYVDPRDVGAVAAAAVTQDALAGTVLAPTGPAAISYDDIARDLAAVTGRPVDYVDVDDETARRAMLDAGLPAPVADAIVTAYGMYRTGAMAAVSGDVRAVTGREPRSFAAWAREHAAAFGTAAAAAA
jgi:uncharacterized protein YbjT (DUF2867 family)